jgi:hypothetical protein
MKLTPQRPVTRPTGGGDVPRMCMRVIPVLLAAVLAVSPVDAAQRRTSQAPPGGSGATVSSPPQSQPPPLPSSSPPSSSGSAGASPGQDEKAPDDLPISMDRIRQALEQSSDKPPLVGLGPGEVPNYRLEVHAPRGLQDLLDSMRFDTGPTPPGGLYGYEQQQNVWSKQQHPEMQPYGAFGQGEAITILLENLLEKYMVARVADAVTNARHATSEEAAREEVQRALAEFWAYQAQQRAAQGQTTPR